MLYYAKMFFGSTGALDTQTVTTGALGSGSNRKRGFSSGSFGSIVSGNSGLYGGAAITLLYWDESGGAGAETTYFRVTGTLANSGWSQMKIDTVIYLRANATFSTAGGFSTWSWGDVAFATQPFGLAGSAHSIVFS